MSLVEIPELAVALKEEKTAKVKLLHELLFGNSGDRKNRERIRQFTGFGFPPDGKELKNKIENVKTEFTLNNLISLADMLQISNEGTTDVIATRIVSCLNNLDELKNNMLHEDSESDFDDIDNESNKSVGESTPKNNNCSQVRDNSSTLEQATQPPIHHNFVKDHVSFLDFESFVPPFEGTNSENVEAWLDNYEDVASLLSLTELQKIIFAKRSMQGKAKLLLASEPKIHTYEKFKQIMLEEFGDTSNSAEIHEILSRRKMRYDETVEEYFLHMKQLARKGKIEDAALMHYIINGINEDVFKKASLYGCQNLNEFKSKLKIFEKMKIDDEKNKVTKYRNEQKQQKNDGQFRVNHGNKSSSERTVKVQFDKNKGKDKFYQYRPSGRNFSCFACGDKSHVAKNCPDKDRGNKCFVCSCWGHRSFECPKKDTKPEVSTINITTKSSLIITAKFNDFSVNSLIDTGSQATVLKKSIFDKLKIDKLYPLNSTLSGFGRCQVQPIGYFKCNIEIDALNCTADVYVIEDRVMSHEAIIGLNVLMQGETIISENSVIVKSKCPEVEEINSITVLPVNETCNETEINIGFDVPKFVKNEVQQLVLNYQPRKTKSTNVQLKVCVKSSEPISHQPRRLPFCEKKIVEDQVAEWLEAGIVEPSSSEYCSPLVIVKKKDGTPRVCVDYRKLNKVIVKDRFPLPLIEDILDRLQGVRIFSTIDLRNGFFHVDVEKESRKYTSFVTHEGQYQYLKVPFGLCNSPAVFQRFINTIFRPLINEGIVLPYMDDVIILSSSVEEGIDRLKLVLNLARDYGLEINFKKSQFLRKRIEFLGHVIEEGKIYPSSLKTQAVSNFPEPINVKQVQSYLGLTGYFRKFIPKYSIVARPLSDLLKKGKKFVFGDVERSAFIRLKSLLAEKPVLAIYNPSYETELHTDASLDGYGAILLQRSPNDNHFHPTYFMSKKTTDAEKKYSSYELEVLAIIEALKKFRVYLLGIPFKIVTDCAAFQKTMEKKDLATRVARWVLLLQEFNYVIEHRPGSKMPHVDALSRSPVNVMCISIENLLPKIKLAQENDSEVKAIKELLAVSNYDNYCVRNGILYKFVDGKELLVLPESMQAEIIKNAHEKGHTGVKHTEKHLEEYYYIPKLRNKIERTIANCVHCILVNRKRGKKEGFLHPRYKEDLPLHTYHIDHIGPLESTHKNYKHILVVIDAFTKFVWIYPTKSTTSSEVIAKLNIQKAVFGSPSQIITDKGTAFTSSEFSDYCAQEEITHHKITTGLPRANGQVERINQVIISVLAKLSLEDPSEWYKHTNELQRILNSTYHRSIDTTPFELLFGTKMNSKDTDKLKELIEHEFRDQFEARREDLRKHAKQQIFKVQQENRKTYNLRRRKPQLYKIGDLVAIKRTQFGPNLKLKAQFFGPYKITKIKGGDTYDVRKEGYHEGPQCTSTCAEFMKNWTAISDY